MQWTACFFLEAIKNRKLIGSTPKKRIKDGRERKITFVLDKGGVARGEVERQPGLSISRLSHFSKTAALTIRAWICPHILFNRIGQHVWLEGVDLWSPLCANTQHCLQDSLPGSDPTKSNKNAKPQTPQAQAQYSQWLSESWIKLIMPARLFCYF